MRRQTHEEARISRVKLRENERYAGNIDFLGSGAFEYGRWPPITRPVANKTGPTVTRNGYTKVITRLYQSTGYMEVPGRDGGFQIGTSQNADADYDLAYYYDGYGRHFALTGTGLPSGGSVLYGRLSNSNLIQTVNYNTTGGWALKITREYDDDRDLLDWIKTEINTDPDTLVSKYEYGYDDLGRRTSVVNDDLALAFSQDELNLWTYNGRSELTLSKRHEGDDPSSPGTEIEPQRREYDYGNIGNREDGTEGVTSATTTYYCANNLNQYGFLDDEDDCPSPGTPTETFDYDQDGNLVEDDRYTFVWDAENPLLAGNACAFNCGDAARRVKGNRLV